MNAALRPDSTAMCQLHRDAVATETCARCGRFACTDCLPGRNVCRACAAQVLTTSPVFGRARWARWTLVATAVFEVLIGLESIVLPPLLREGGEVHPLVEGAIWLPAAVVRIATAVAFLMWLHAFIASIWAMKLELTDSAAIAVVWWFVPLANAVKPYRTLREAMAQLRSRGLVDEARLGWWWGLYLTANTGALVASLPWVLIAVQTLGAISALLGARMIRVINEALRDYAAPEAVVEALPVSAPLAPAATA